MITCQYITTNNINNYIVLDCRKSDLEQVFKKYSKDYVVEDVQIEDFDYCMYFIDETVNKYMYCIKDEGVHLTYHRFTREDYKELNYFSV